MPGAARVLKEVQHVGQDVRDIPEVRVFEARVNSAVIVNVGAYLAPVLGFAALAYSLGQIANDHLFVSCLCVQNDMQW